MKDIKNIIGIFKGLVEKNEKLYTASFEIDGKNWKFKCWKEWTKKDGTVKQGVKPEDLEINQAYKIGFTEYQTADMNYPAKTAVCFFIAAKTIGKGDRMSTYSSPSSRVDIALQNIMKLEHFQKFAEQYVAQVDKDRQTINGMMGTYLRNYHKDEFKPLLEACAKALGKELR